MSDYVGLFTVMVCMEDYSCALPLLGYIITVKVHRSVDKTTQVIPQFRPCVEPGDKATV